MVVSKIRKEEAELRQIAKQSRLARKEANARERKQQQREMRARARAEAAGETVPEASATKAAPRKRQAAIILPEEVQELKQRLVLGGGSEAPEQSLTSKTKAKAKKGKKDLKGQAQAQAQPQQPSKSSSSSGTEYAVPNHHVEVHYKKKQILVDVVLHHVPPTKIDLSETSATQLVVDTTKHTKKYRLVLPMPNGIRVIPADAEYESENGVLKCVLPIEGSEIPEELQKKWDDMIDTIRQQKVLRFRTGKDGELVVRSRQALLAKDTAAQAALQEKARKERKRGRDGEDEEDGKDEAARAAEEERRVAETIASLGASKTQQKGKATKAHQQSKNEEGSDADESAGETAAPAAKKTKMSAKQATSGKVKADVFAADHAKAMEAARAAASQAHQTIRERVKLARQVQAQRQTRIGKRSEKRERKQEKKVASLQRVLDDQKQQLVAKQQLAAAVEEAEKKRAKARSNSSPGKSVSFV